MEKTSARPNPMEDSTKRPWYIHQQSEGGFFISGETRDICFLGDGMQSFVDGLAIIHAVNNHDALVEVAKYLKDMFDDEACFCDLTDHGEKLYDLTIAALKAVKKG